MRSRKHWKRWQNVMEHYERYQRIRLARKDLEKGHFPLTREEGIFLKELLDMPEGQVFLDESFRNFLQEKLMSVDTNNVERLGEFQVSSNWKNEVYIKKARHAIEIVKRNVDFSYQNRTFRGTMKEGVGCPIAIQVDVFSREWYLNFIDLGSKEEVLANLSRLTFLKMGENSSLSPKDKLDIKEKRKKQKLTLAVKNYKGAIERACALFALKQRFMQYDRNTDEMVLEISYCDYEKENILSDIFSLGDLAVVREPEKLREEIFCIVKEMLGNI